MKQSNDDNNNDKNDSNDDNNNIESYNDANKLPSMVLMTINLGSGSYLGYNHFDLTLYSMQYNKDVDFILIHVMVSS